MLSTKLILKFYAKTLTFHSRDCAQAMQLKKNRKLPILFLDFHCPTLAGHSETDSPLGLYPGEAAGQPQLDTPSPGPPHTDRMQRICEITVVNHTQIYKMVQAFCLYAGRQ
ncbi:UNVERIFIED_CONTAM: hypothetical protein K2H54_017945 [Gekko kuhli]